MCTVVPLRSMEPAAIGMPEGGFTTSGALSAIIGVTANR